MFKRIALIANKNRQKITETLRSVSNYLLNRNIDIVLNSFSADLMQDSDLRAVPDEQLPLQCDMAIAIGGDGTMLWAAQLLADYDVPLLGINRGRLGFLADIPADSVEEHLQQILDGHYIEDERIQLHCQVERDNKIIKESHAFNDIIVQKWNIAKLIELTTYVDQTLLHSQRSDGMIISSPTGSTAYALSGGGPILHPALDALVLVPICPHTLSNRPIVIDGNSRIEIVVGTPEIDHASLTCDGEIICDLLTGDRIIIHKKNKKIRLIHPPGYDHFSTLRAKLQWG
ncbi:MAG: NAD(+) kinase [Gammaproteobacteria bacterium]|nr:NAD(+) kinase [Gammaproteobacteria bacterium]